MIAALVQCALRVLLSGAVVIGSTVLALFGGGRDAFFFVATVGMFSVGWSLLPAIRASRIFATLGGVAWVGLAVFLAQFGDSTVRGWMLGPYAVATTLLAFCLARKPPLYIRAAKCGAQRADAA